MSESWGYRCESCGENQFTRPGAIGLLETSLQRMRAFAALNLAFRVLRELGRADNVQVAMGGFWEPFADFLDEHQGHDVVLVGAEGRGVPLFPDNAPLPHDPRGFLHALADDCLDVAALGVFFDVLEEAGLTAAGLRVRKLTPRAGDVLVLSLSGPAPGRYADDYRNLVAEAARFAGAAERSCGVPVYVITDRMALETANEEALERMGWVRAGRVAEAVAAERDRVAGATRAASRRARELGEAAMADTLESMAGVIAAEVAPETAP